MTILSESGVTIASGEDRPGLLGSSSEEQWIKPFKPSQIWGPRRKQFVDADANQVKPSREFKPVGLDSLTHREETPPPPDECEPAEVDEAEPPEQENPPEAVAAPEPEPPVVVVPPPPAEPDPKLLEASFQDGFAAGEKAARDALEQRKTQLDAMLEQIGGLLQRVSIDPLEQFAPLKRLSLHIAEEVVRGELQVPERLIEQLVQRALEEVNGGGGLPVRIHLNPEDARHYREHLRGRELDFDLIEDEMVSRGSIKLRTDATAVDDLIDHRLQSIAEGLLGHHEQWRPRVLGADASAQISTTEPEEDLGSVDASRQDS